MTVDDDDLQVNKNDWRVSVVLRWSSSPRPAVLYVAFIRGNRRRNRSPRQSPRVYTLQATSRRDDRCDSCADDSPVYINGLLCCSCDVVVLKNFSDRIAAQYMISYRPDSVVCHSVCLSVCIRNAQNPLHQFPRNIPVDVEAANLFRTCYGLVTGKLL